MSQYKVVHLNLYNAINQCYPNHLIKKKWMKEGQSQHANDDCCIREDGESQCYLGTCKYM